MSDEAWENFAKLFWGAVIVGVALWFLNAGDNVSRKTPGRAAPKSTKRTQRPRREQVSQALRVEPKAAETSAWPLRGGPGSKATLSSPAGQIPVCIDERTLRDWYKAANANDTHGGNELLLSGRMFLVQSGIEVLILEAGWGKKKVRVLGGTYEGKAGWVQSHCVKD